MIFSTKHLAPLAFFLLALTSAGFAQLSKEPQAVTGRFYVAVDDAATISINGKEVFAATHGESKSEELTLKEGDHLVVKLRDDGGERKFVMALVATDGKSMVNFTGSDFRIVPDVGVTNFTEAEYKGWSKRGKNIGKPGEKLLPVKTYSRNFWGDLNSCTVAAVVTPEMFSKGPQ